MIPEARAGGFNLIFDADDTLWDSNVYFLEAEAQFFELLCAAGLSTPDEVRAAIRQHELDIIAEVGYGRGPYVRALHRTVRELVPIHRHDALAIEVDRIGERLLARNCELLPEVEPTLRELARRHRLLLFTKGQPHEQMAKLERAGLRSLFSRVGIPVEKDPGAYALLVAQAGLDPARTFMIGNSPRSDINPALRAGLRGAVFIPHPHTWELEHEELDAAEGRVVTISAFRELLELF
ncbi:MAG TPA: HAD family hydrolase [Candidatus Binataceae bacterium]|nr:HAD family hydrolase [Candidatus Binataceae bacterium]